MKIQGRSWKKTYLGIFAAVVLIMVSLLFLDILANAENVKMGTVINIDAGSSLNLRSGPGTGYNKIGSLKNGQSGEVLDEGYASNGKLWYKLYISGMTGWASSDYIKVTEYAVTEDEDFDAYLTAQGFPESYKSQLQALHNLYPNWKFEAQITNLNWNDVIAAESTLGKNLVHSSSITSWKSTQSGAYDWTTGEWTVFDSGGWVMASKEMIEYSMDPRNFLDSVNVFQFIKQSYNANALNSTQLAQKKSDLTNMVQGTYLAGTCDGRSYVDVIMDVAASTGVCPFTLASMMIQEQGTNGTGRSISGTVSGYEGYYNYFNIGAFATSTMTAVERGLWYAKGSGEGATSYGRPWNTRTRSITGGALYYGTNYVNVGQDTLYLKKFNVQGSNIYNHQYMTNVQGAISEGQHVSEAYDANARKAALVFKIPVYKNMPSTACTKPTGNDNPNYMLKSLSVAGQSLTPTFSVYETEYSLIVPNNVSSITISASAIASTTSVSGTGTKSLNVGTNSFAIKTTAQNGATRTYTLTVVRQAAPSAGGTGSSGSSGGSGTTSGTVSKPTSSKYDVNSNNTVSGIDTFPVSASDFKKNFNVTNGTVKITTASGSEVTGNVGTGHQVRVYDASGALKYTYNVVIYGDTNGDGNVDTLDYIYIKRHILGKELAGAYKLAADASRGGEVDTLDYILVKRQILGLYEIKQ